MRPLNPDVADLAPSDLALTTYDEERAITYLCMLDSDGARWRGSCCISTRTANLIARGRPSTAISPWQMDDKGRILALASTRLTAHNSCAARINKMAA